MNEMRNLVGTPVRIGAVTMRAATGYLYGGVVYHGLVQREMGPNHWSTGRDCRHRHQTAITALQCAEQLLEADGAAVALLVAPDGRQDVFHPNAYDLDLDGEQ